MFMNRFVKAIENAITNQRKLFNIEINTMKDLFIALDRNGDGEVDATELSEALVSIQAKRASIA